MKTSATNRKVWALLEAVSNGTLVLRPEFQRRLVWSNKHKVAFLDTVLKGYPFPEIYISEGIVDTKTAEGHEFLVDGQQRITTLYQYFKGGPELKLPKDMARYADLDKDIQTEFLEYEVVVRDLGVQNEREIIEIFRRINSTNYALNPMEINHAVFDGDMEQLAESVAGRPFFENHDVFHTTEIRRMADVRFALNFVVTIMSSYFNRDELLGPFLEKYNEAFDEREQVEHEIDATLDFVDKMGLAAASRVWQKADLFTLLVEVHRALSGAASALDPQVTGQRLTSFYSRVESQSNLGQEPYVTYYKMTREASNDRGPRMKRGSIIQSVIGGELTFDES